MINYFKSSVARNFTNKVYMLQKRCNKSKRRHSLLSNPPQTRSFYRLWHDTDAVADRLSSGVSLARCWRVRQGLSEIPALLSVWAGKNHVKPVLLRPPAAPTIYGWSQGGCCCLASLHGVVVRISSYSETRCLKECKIVRLLSRCVCVSTRYDCLIKSVIRLWYLHAFLNAHICTLGNHSWFTWDNSLVSPDVNIQ